MLAARKRPRTRTASTCTAAETDRATHSFKIVGSSLHRGFGVGKYVRSATFATGGYDWCIHYYPDAHSVENKDYVAVFLELRTTNVEVTVLYDLRVVNPATRLSSSICSYKAVFNDASSTWGTVRFMKKTDLEARGYLRDDSMEIECDVTVIKVNHADVPPSDILDHLGKLLESEEGKDVRFKVEKEVFSAHKIVLMMRSPVFKAEFYGPMSDKRKRTIVVEDMQPAVFEALLHFVYKDSLPAMDDLHGSENEEMVRHLLVAADRYALERMKLMCEAILCNRLDVENVATNLALADQHHCSKLKDACIRFINSSNRMDDVMASKGYEQLKRACPALTVEIWEKSSKSSKQTHALHDMEPHVFKALLHFIYTDSFPDMDDLDGHVNEETIRHLLVAADRYATKRLELICEDILCKRLDVESVADTSAFADEQRCRKLRETCIAFIKRVCPDVFIDLWEKEAKSRRI